MLAALLYFTNLLLPVLVLRIHFKRLFIMEQGKRVLFCLHISIGQAVIAVPGFWKVVDIQLKYMNSGLGFSFFKKLVTGIVQIRFKNPDHGIKPFGFNKIGESQGVVSGAVSC